MFQHQHRALAHTRTHGSVCRSVFILPFKISAYVLEQRSLRLILNQVLPAHQGIVTVHPGIQGIIGNIFPVTDAGPGNERDTYLSASSLRVDPFLDSMKFSSLNSWISSSLVMIPVRLRRQ